MLNLLISVGAGLVAFALFRFTGVTNTLGALLPALIAFAAAYFLLARRTMRQLEGVMKQVEKELQAQKFDRALQILRDAFPLARWQFLVDGQLHGQIGSLLYVQKKFDEAEPHLEKAFVKIWPARAMLGAQHFRRKQWAEMEKVFEQAVKSNKKEALLWAVYAWCEDKRGERKRAIGILQRGLGENPSDERLKTLLQRAQNDKRLKMDAWGHQWWQFWLETPQLQPQGTNPFLGGRNVRRMRR